MNNDASNLYAPPLVQGIVSFAFLIGASWCVGEGGEILGELYDASLVGGLLIAWLNTLPEAIFFITALHTGNPDFAAGAMSGSTIVVCTLATGACFWVSHAVRGPRKFRLQPNVREQCRLLLLSVAFPLLSCVFGFSLPLSLAAVGAYGAFVLNSLRGAADAPAAVVMEDDPEAARCAVDSETDESESESEVELESEPPHSAARGFGLLLVGGLAIFLFSEPFIAAVMALAGAWGVSPTLLAFFLAPIASEAPEILESVSLARKGTANSFNVACSNLAGGTISKTTLLVGIFGLYGVYKDFEWAPQYTLALAMEAACAAATAVIGTTVDVPTREHAMYLLALFCITAVLQYMTQ